MTITVGIFFLGGEKGDAKVVKANVVVRDKVNQTEVNNPLSQK